MFRDEAALEDALSEPTPQVVETLARNPGDIVFLVAATGSSEVAGWLRPPKEHSPHETQ